jgi:hypothetical protein
MTFFAARSFRVRAQARELDGLITSWVIAYWWPARGRRAPSGERPSALYFKGARNLSPPADRSCSARRVVRVDVLKLAMLHVCCLGGRQMVVKPEDAARKFAKGKTRDSLTATRVFQLVEMRGLEPLTPYMRSKCSTS